MLTTYQLIDGRHITGDTNDLDIVSMDRMTKTDWDDICKAVEAGRTVINLRHVAYIHKPTDEDVHRYKCQGY